MGKDEEISQEHAQVMLDALDHIARAARCSRTMTKRMRWIEKRAFLAVRGEKLSDRAGDLPKMDQNAPVRLQKHIDGLEAEIVALRGSLDRIVFFFGEDACATYVCKYSDPLHYHHDGCPSCEGR